MKIVYVGCSVLREQVMVLSPSEVLAERLSIELEKKEAAEKMLAIIEALREKKVAEIRKKQTDMMERNTEHIQQMLIKILTILGVVGMLIFVILSSF